MKKFIKKIFLSLFVSLFVLCTSINTYETLREPAALEQEINLHSLDGDEASDPFTRQ